MEVHVITISPNGVLDMKSFKNNTPNDVAGTILAEKEFENQIKKYGSNDMDAVDLDCFIEESLENGYCIVNGYNINLVHSNPINV
jgi:hypothetical protein